MYRAQGDSTQKIQAKKITTQLPPFNYLCLGEHTKDMLLESGLGERVDGDTIPQPDLHRKPDWLKC